LRAWACTAVCFGRFEMIALIYATAALGVGIYMVAALVRPDKF
jgi:hypothetical protein